MKLIRNATPKLAVLLAVLLMGGYAAQAAPPFTPTSVSIPVAQPNGIMATSQLLLVSSQLGDTIYSLTPAGVYSGNGTLTVGNGIYTTLPAHSWPTAQGDNAQEVYFAMSGGLGGFTNGDIFAMRGQNVYKIGTAAGAIASPTAFNTTPICAHNTSHTGITFDNSSAGTFGNAMLITCGEDGSVEKVSSTGVVTLLAQLAVTVTETPAVVGASFTGGNNGFGAGSQVFVAQENINLVRGIGSAANTVSSVTMQDPEGAYVVPGGSCNFGGAAYFSVRFPIGGGTAMMDEYPAADFVGLTGQLIIPTEFPDNSFYGTASPAVNVSLVDLAGHITAFDGTNLNGWNREGSTFTQCVAIMPIIKLSSDPNTPPTSSDFIFGLYPRGNNSFTNPPTGTPYNYLINSDGTISCPAGSFQATDDRGTCILTPPEGTLPIQLSSGAFNASVCELKHTAGWTFSSWTVTFTGTPTDVTKTNFASATAYHPIGETTDPEIECIDLTIWPGTTKVELDVTDTPPTQPTGGRFTGGGSFFPTNANDTPSDTSERITHGFELHCNASKKPNNLEVNWAGTGNGKNAENNFHMDNLTKAQCIDDPDIEEGPPEAPLNTYEGIGTGKFNGVAGAIAHWVFTDDGEPGVNDEVWIEVWDKTGKLVLRIGNFTGSKTILLTPSALGALVTVPGSAGDTGAHLDKGNQQAHK